MSKHWRSVLGGAALLGLGMVGVASLSALIVPPAALAGSPAWAVDGYVPPPDAPRTDGYVPPPDGPRTEDTCGPNGP